MNDGVYNSEYILIGMDDITEEEYEKVLQYMEAVSEEDFSAAIAAMKSHDFNLQIAISSKYDNAPSSRTHHSAHSQVEDEQIVRRYIDFSERKNRQWSFGLVVVDIIKYLLSALFSLLTSFLPTSLYVRFFGTPFQKIYGASIRHQYTHRPLAYYLPKTKNLSSKSVLLLVSPRNQHPEVLAFLNDQSLQRKITQSFFLTCYVAGAEELAQVEGCREGPLLVALRWSIFEELREVGREKQLKRVTADLLNRWAHEGRNLFKRDGNVLVKYRNFLARTHGIHYEEEEEEEVNLLQRDLEKRQIHQQNQAYKEAEEQRRKAKEAEEEQLRRAAEEERARQQLLEERKIRKMSIPDEPTEGDIVRLSFRCPDGSTIFRNFHANEKLELVFHWVQLNEEIQFEEQKRHFEIMYSYPPVPLSSQKDRLLSEVFDSSQEKVLIREL